MNNQPIFPYSAIVGQEDFKLALELNLVDQSIGGVLAVGDKGTGKTTTVRSLGQLMANVDEAFKFVNLPIGASEDRVLGTVDLEKLINEKKQVLQQGLLANAHQGILYIDEVNLMNDYLTDILLDAAATGGYYLEREGLSLWQESKFCLAGTMNPEEGELRPQLLDRFGLSVDIRSPLEAAVRQSITERRIKFDRDPEAYTKTWEAQQLTVLNKIVNARNHLDEIAIDQVVYNYVAELCLQHEVEGMRADILLLKTGKAFAALNDDKKLSKDHIDAIAHLVLRHRSNNPQPQSNNEDKGPEGNNNQHRNEHNDQQDQLEEQSPREHNEKFDKQQHQQKIEFFRKQSNSNNPSRKGIDVDKMANTINRPEQGKSQNVKDLYKTVKNYTVTGNFKVHYQPDQSKSGLTVFFIIDSSRSMAHQQQIGYVKGMISHTLSKYKGRPIQFAGIGLVNGQASITNMPTRDANVFLQGIESLPTGGKTNLTAGLYQVHHFSKNYRSSKSQTQLYILTDGRINTGNHNRVNPMDEAIQYYKRYLQHLDYTQIIDTESGFVKLGAAKKLAERMKVRYTGLNQ